MYVVVEKASKKFMQKQDQDHDKIKNNKNWQEAQGRRPQSQ